MSEKTYHKATIFMTNLSMNSFEEQITWISLSLEYNTYIRKDSHFISKLKWGEKVVHVPRVRVHVTEGIAGTLLVF